MFDPNFQWSLPAGVEALHDEHVTRFKLFRMGINLEAWDRPFDFDAQPLYARVLKEIQDGHN